MTLGALAFSRVSKKEESIANAITTVGTPNVEWNNIDYVGWAPGLNANNVPTAGYVLLLLFPSNISNTLFTDRNLINGGVSGCNVGDYVLINGVQSKNVSGAIIYCYPFNGLYVYLPSGAVPAGSYPTVSVLEGMSIDGSAHTGASTFVFKGGLGDILCWSYVEESPALTLSGIAAGWNNDTFPTTPGYNHIILYFGTFGIDYFSISHGADPTNRANDNNAIGRNLKFNGLSIADIAKKYPLTSVDYAHGNNYMHIQYPDILTYSTSDYLVPTVELNENTDFIDKSVQPFKLQLIGGRWGMYDFPTICLEHSINLDNYFLGISSLPYTFGSDPVCLFNVLPFGVSEISFMVNFGNYNPSSPNNVLSLNPYGKFTVAMLPSSSAILYSDTSGNNGALTIPLEPNRDYLVEIYVECGTHTNFTFALDHAVLFNYQTNIDTTSSESGTFWANNPDCNVTIKKRENANQYLPKIKCSGSSNYDFLAGDPIYDFASIVDVDCLYSNASKNDLTFEYSEGAVTNGKYNQGDWKLLITLDNPNYPKVLKTIDIHVYGSISYASVTFGDNDPIQVIVGSKLKDVKAPIMPSDADHDYVFAGWYYNGFPWDFDNNVVEGDMVLEPHYITTERHYVVTVTFEGINKPVETYKVNKNASVPFDLFNESAAKSFKVYKGNTRIYSLRVTNDVTIRVVYEVTFSYHPFQESTCSEYGHIAYYSNDAYPGYYFYDASGIMLIDEVLVPKLPHTIVSSGDAIGSYTCSVCHQHFLDINGEILIPEGVYQLLLVLSNGGSYSSPTSGTGKCISEGWYNSAKTLFNALTLEDMTLFMSDSYYENERNRLVAWANANNEAIVYENNTYIIRAKVVVPTIFSSSNNNSLYLVMTISLLLIAMCGFAIYKKKGKAK